MLNGKGYLNKNTNITYEKIPLYNKNYLVINHIKKRNDPSFTVEKHWHRAIEMIIPYTSSINACINGINYLIPRNHVLFINSKAIHLCTLVDSDEYYKGIVVQISYDYLISKYKKFSNMNFPVMFDLQTEKELIYCINGLKKEVDKNDDASQFAKDGFIDLIVAILIRNQINDEDYDRDNEIQNKFSTKLSYMEANYDQIDSIEQVAKKFNYSYGYLARWFKVNFGMSIKHYLTSLKLEKSLDDVAFTNKKILDIALEHGFSSIQAYNREFKKNYCITPTDYRKQVRK